MSRIVFENCGKKEEKRDRSRDREARRSCRRGRHALEGRSRAMGSGLLSDFSGTLSLVGALVPVPPVQSMLSVVVMLWGEVGT